jgi:hypothetical protein
VFDKIFMSYTHRYMLTAMKIVGGRTVVKAYLRPVVGSTSEVCQMMTDWSMIHRPVNGLRASLTMNRTIIVKGIHLLSSKIDVTDTLVS